MSPFSAAVDHADEPCRDYPVARAVVGVGIMGRREQSNQRFQQGFLAEFAFQVRAFARQLRADAEASADVGFELARLGAQAETLQLANVGQVAQEASKALSEPGESTGDAGLGLGALRRVASAIREARGPLRLGPVIVVGGTAAEQSQLQAEAAYCAEPIEVFPELASFASDLHPDRPEAVVLPLAATDALAQMASREPRVLLAHGDSTHVSAVAQALDAGAHGMVSGPLTLASVLRAVRWRGRRSIGLRQIVLAHDPGPERDALAQRLGATGSTVHPVEVHVVSDVPELLGCIEAGPAAVVALGAPLAGRPARQTLQVLRAHPHGHSPVVVLGPGPNDLGVEVISTWSDAESVAVRIAGWAQHDGGPRRWDWVTGLHTRLGVLEAVDQALLRHSRTRAPLALALLDVAGLGQAIAEHGPSVADVARRQVAELLRRGVRDVDAAGELGPGQWLIVFERAGRQDVDRRLTELATTYVPAPSLAATRLVWGLADTFRGPRGLAVRAETDLATRLALPGRG
ncbi:MAG: GGDEF domain-containing protein [Myxococcota bacterium]